MLAVDYRRRDRIILRMGVGMMAARGGLKEFTFSKVAYLFIFSYLGTSIVYLNFIRRHRRERPRLPCACCCTHFAHIARIRIT